MVVIVLSVFDMKEISPLGAISRNPFGAPLNWMQHLLVCFVCSTFRRAGNVNYDLVIFSSARYVQALLLTLSRLCGELGG